MQYTVHILGHCYAKYQLWSNQLYCGSPTWQVTLINASIDQTRPGSRLHSLQHVSDPSDEVVEVLIIVHGVEYWQ